MIENFDQKFLAFAESKPADERYAPGDISTCALAQFAKSYGATFTGAIAYNMDHRSFGYPEKSYKAAIPDTYTTYTWGAVAQRLRKQGVTP